DPSDSYAIGATRIACGISGATQEVTADFTKRYRLNENPSISSLTLVGATSIDVAPDAPGSSPGATVKTGEKLTLRATLAACTMPAGCTGSEQYLVFDPATRALAVHREAIRIAWFATGGALANDDVGHSEGEADDLEIANAWTAPNEP